jgi:hypothetical protein
MNDPLGQANPDRRAQPGRVSELLRQTGVNVHFTENAEKPVYERFARFIP